MSETIYSPVAVGSAGVLVFVDNIPNLTRDLVLRLLVLVNHLDAQWWIFLPLVFLVVKGNVSHVARAVGELVFHVLVARVEILFNEWVRLSDLIPLILLKIIRRNGLGDL